MYSQPSSCKMGFRWLAVALILIPQETSEHKETTVYSSDSNDVGSVPFCEYNYQYLLTIPYQSAQICKSGLVKRCLFIFSNSDHSSSRLVSCTCRFYSNRQAIHEDWYSMNTAHNLQLIIFFYILLI